MQSTDSNMNSSSICEMTGFDIYTREIHTPAPSIRGPSSQTRAQEKNKNLTLFLVHVNIKASFQDDKDFLMLVLVLLGLLKTGLEQNFIKCH